MSNLDGDVNDNSRFCCHRSATIIDADHGDPLTHTKSRWCVLDVVWWRQSCPLLMLEFRTRASRTCQEHQREENEPECQGSNQLK